MRLSRVIPFMLLFICTGAIDAAAATVAGTVRDASGAAIVGAEVVLLTPERTVIASARTDEAGRFSLTVPSRATYLVVVRAQYFGTYQVALAIGHTDPAPLAIVLNVAELREELTVTAS